MSDISPEITVITVCRNVERYLGETIASVLVQQKVACEYLIVDGASTDGTLALVRAAAARDRRIAWSSGTDAGIADAMNRGLAKARGEIVAFLHADDCYPAADVLATVTAALRARPDRDWLTGGVREIDAAGRRLRTVGVRRFSRRRLLRNNIILHPATFVRRAALLAANGFDPALRYAMDYDLWLRLARRGPPLTLDRELACFRVHAGGLSSANRRAALAEEYLVRRRYLAGPLSWTAHSLYHWWRLRRIPRDA
jgi:glycosyltransferase involved in cell wall biosynthesis